MHNKFTEKPLLLALITACTWLHYFLPFLCIRSSRQLICIPIGQLHSIGASPPLLNHWRKPCGHPRTSWLRRIDTDVQSVDIEIHSAWRKASDRTLWWSIVNTATVEKTEKLKSKKMGMLRSISKQLGESMESVLKKKMKATVGMICGKGRF